MKQQHTIEVKWPRYELRHVDGDQLWANRYYAMVRSADGGRTWERVTRIPAPALMRLLARVIPIKRLLRKGIRSTIQIDDRSFVAFGEGKIFYWREGLERPVLSGRVRYGHGPLPQGCCVDPSGTCFYGEYWGNPDREEVHIYRWQPGEDAWRSYYRFPPSTIRHVHAVQYDPYSDRLWTATGDHDDECMIGFFEETGSVPQFVEVFGGSQNARAVSLIFTRDHIYWGTDAGRKTENTFNQIFRRARDSGEVEAVGRIPGPVYYSTISSSGRMFVSTTVEGSPSEQDDYARVYTSDDGSNWRELLKLKKDRCPMAFGYGILSFPMGTIDDQLYVVGNGVKSAPATWRIDLE